MAKYKSSFIGTFDRETDSSDSSSGGYTSPFTGTFAAKKKRKEDEDANQKYADELRQEAEKKAAKANDKGWTPLKNIGDFVGDAAKGIAAPFQRVGEGLGEAVYDATGGNERDQKAYQKSQDDLSKTQLAMIKKAKAETDPAKKARYEQAAASIGASMDSNYKSFSNRNKDIVEKVDPVKNAAAIGEIGFDIATLGTGSAAAQAGKSGLKVVGRKVIEGAMQGAVAGGLSEYERKGGAAKIEDVAKSAAIGGVVGGVIPGAGYVGGKALRTGDKMASKAIVKLVDSQDERIANAVTQIGENGIMGTLNKALSRTGSKVAYAASDAMQKTKLGSKVVDLKDDFMSKWVTEFHPLYKTLKRSDFEGKTTGAYVAAREAIGNSNRALSYAQDFVENNENMQKLTGSLAARDLDLVKSRATFDEFAKLKSDLDLVAAGKKEFSESKVKALNARMAKLKDSGLEKEYGDLVNFYKDINDFRLENGLISKEQYDQFADEGFDYIRQQRELPQWMLDKPGGGKGGSVASITRSDAIQARNKYASAEQLSPMETALRTAQLAHVEAYRNKAAKTVYSLLDEGGEAKLLRSTDMVDEKKALITAMKESKPIVTKMDKLIRSNKRQVASIQKEMTALRNQGKSQLKKEIKNVTEKLDKAAAANPALPSNPKAIMEELLTMDNKELRKTRRMLEARDAKLGPILDKIELLNRDLSDLHAQRSGMWNQANSIKLGVDKSKQTTMSFLDDGVENVAKIDPVIASAIQNWDKQSQNVMNNVLRFSNNVFKYGTTGANVGFALPNFVADQVGSAVNSKALLSTHNPVNFVHSFFMTIGKPLNAKDAQILRAYTMGNKGALSINQYTKTAVSDKAVNNLVKASAETGNKLYTKLRHPKEAFRALFDATEGAVGLTENLTRVQNFRGTYNKAVKEGLDGNAVKLANQAARENSIDFLEMGSYGRVINSLIPYFNAGIQGSRTIMRNAAERPASFMAKTTALIGVPVAATTVWNVSDPERKKIYDTIPEYVKDTNMIIIGPNAKWNEKTKKWDGVFLMKKPPGLKEFAEPIRKFIEYKADDPNADLGSFLRDEGGSVAADFGSAITPIDFTDQNKFLSSVTPQLLKPTAEAILNRNFFTGQDIVGENMADMAPEDQKYDDYSQLTSHIAAMFNTSPLKVDSWIKGTFGEVGTNAQYYTDRLMADAGLNPDNNVGGRSLPESISRRFVGATGGADSDAFYNDYNPASSARKRASKNITDLVKQGKINEAKRRAEEYNSTIKDRFRGFIGKYGESPTYDSKWDDRIQELFIPTTEQSFKARAKQ